MKTLTLGVDKNDYLCLARKWPRLGDSMTTSGRPHTLFFLFSDVTTIYDVRMLPHTKPYATKNTAVHGLV